VEEDKKFYWLKLKKDFFKRHDIRIIEDMPNGKDYVLFYLKLLCESVDHEGNLRFSEQIPYNEKMLSTITNTNVDIVRSAIKVFTELQLMEVLDDKTIYMSEVSKMMGFETEWAKKKREYRERIKSGQCPQNVLTMSDKSIEKEKEKELEKDIDIYTSNACACEETAISNLQELIKNIEILYSRCLTMKELAQVELLSKKYDSQRIYNEIKNNIDKDHPIAYICKTLSNISNYEDKREQWEKELEEDEWLKGFYERTRQDEEQRKKELRNED